MKKILLSILLLLTLMPAAQAQKMGEAKETDTNLIKAALKGWHVRIGAGVSLGGTSPMPLPAEIRKINSYNPTLCIQLEGAVQRKFGPHWGTMIGVRFENKGMKTDAKVKNYHMEATNNNPAEGTSGQVIGAWTGNVKTEVNNNYLTFPVLAVYEFNDRWQVQAGPYFSYLINGTFKGEAYDGYIRDGVPTGNKAEIESATYDFSNDLRRFAWGVQLGGEFKAYKHLSVSANLTWGCNSIFPSDFSAVTFKLVPIYGTLGFNYLF